MSSKYIITDFRTFIKKKFGRRVNFVKKELEKREKHDMDNNTVSLIGKIDSEFHFSHEVYGESFYTAKLSVKRLSGVIDTIPIMISERLVEVSADYREQYVYVTGQLRSFRCPKKQKRRLRLFVFVRALEFLEGADEECYENQIFLNGYICKDTIYRMTSQGKEIADVMVAVNRAYGKADYVPCIVWGRNAQYVARCEVGTQVQLCGRVQSRAYTKKISETETEWHVAYEVSINKISLPEKVVM